VVVSGKPSQIRGFDDVAGHAFAGGGAAGLCLDESELHPDFFNLRNGVAGELLQKCVNYRLRVALVIADPAKYGERFAELAREHGAHPTVRFVRTREDGERWLRGEG
jgi:hypothetical protein